MVLTAVAVLGTGCGKAAPIDTPDNTWSWVDVPGSTCDEGIPTGLGANLVDGKNLLIFFNGGGACWDASTCLRGNISSHGPFTQPQFDTFVAPGTAHTACEAGPAQGPPQRAWC